MQHWKKGGSAPLFATLVASLTAANLPAEPAGFDAFDATIPELQAAMERKDTTAEELVRQYLQRIDAFDRRGPRLNAMIYVNPRALEAAAALDRERAAGAVRGQIQRL